MSANGAEAQAERQPSYSFYLSDTPEVFVSQHIGGQETEPVLCRLSRAAVLKLLVGPENVRPRERGDPSDTRLLIRLITDAWAFNTSDEESEDLHFLGIVD